jgi:hypothetical protein
MEYGVATTDPLCTSSTNLKIIGSKQLDFLQVDHTPCTTSSATILTTASAASHKQHVTDDASIEGDAVSASFKQHIIIPSKIHSNWLDAGIVEWLLQCPRLSKLLIPVQSPALEISRLEDGACVAAAPASVGYVGYLELLPDLARGAVGCTCLIRGCASRAGQAAGLTGCSYHARIRGGRTSDTGFACGDGVGASWTAGA